MAAVEEDLLVDLGRRARVVVAGQFRRQSKGRGRGIIPRQDGPRPRVENVPALTGPIAQFELHLEEAVLPLGLSGQNADPLGFEAQADAL
jgi:hypothetical protein